MAGSAINARVAQLVEQRIENPRVGGSNPPPGTIYRIYITAMSAFRHMPQVGRVQCVSLLLTWFDSGNRDRGRVRIIIEPVHKVRAMAQHGIVIEIALGGDFMGFD